MQSDKGYENQFGAACDLESVRHYITYDSNLYDSFNTRSELQEETENTLTNEDIPQCIWEDWNYIHPV